MTKFRSGYWAPTYFEQEKRGLLIVALLKTLTAEACKISSATDLNIRNQQKCSKPLHILQEILGTSKGK